MSGWVVCLHFEANFKLLFLQTSNWDARKQLSKEFIANSLVADVFNFKLVDTVKNYQWFEPGKCQGSAREVPAGVKNPVFIVYISFLIF